MPIDRKELYQKRIQDSVIKLADYMMDNSTNGIVAMKAIELRKNCRLTPHLFTEASGRLRAIGFHSGAKSFTKRELIERQGDCSSYYKINPECHPLKLRQEVIDAALKRRERNNRIRHYGIEFANTEFRKN
ncbi:hypothetical protein [Brevibacillus sp. MER 51]|uniref:hypothetical protein n=1 Tax=Brevibacillus sp. MER 51 TaxID=2939560 RepID=UPI0020422022|nr:hypothetical protein [Brevibacillus sp. MER 51]MCM3145078.1 hypothetical protein [Brevibacillus sp. MER 51]